MSRRADGTNDAGLVLTKLAIVAAIATPIGIFAFHAVQDAVRDQTLHTDVRGAVSIEAICNEDMGGVGYGAGSNVVHHGGAFVLNCGGINETVRASAGNELMITVAFDGSSYSITGVQRSTGLRVHYDSATGRTT